MKCKNTIAMVLAGAMLLPSNAFAADLSQYRDFPNDWSAKSLEQAIDDGLLNGSNGMIDAKGLLTRAQMAAIVSRAFGAAKSASLKDYRDMLPDAWYYNDMGRAVQMKAFQGAGGLLHPDDPITREEAFVVLARAFALTDGRSASLSDFSDNGAVSSWASGSLSALVENGYVNGANGRLNPKNNITRAEFAKIITDMAASYADSSSIANQTVDGNLIVRADGASLSGVTVDGVKVTGRIVIRGASTEASLKNCSAGKGVLVSNPNGAAAISVSGGSVGTVTAKSDLVVSGSVDNIVIAEKAALTVQSGASVGSVTVSAAGASVSGAGTVSAVQANANNVTVSTKNTKVTAASGVSGVKAGDKTVDAGKTGTVGTAPSSGGSSSGGGSSSSRSDYSYVLMNIPYNEFYKAELSENAPAVDAVSSATKNKTRNASLAGGSYHVNRDGSDITGVTYPVRVKTSDLSSLKQVTDSDSVSITVINKKGENETTTYNGRDALFENASHSYYVLSSTPSYYKEATLTDGKWTFGKATGAVSEDTATISKFKAPGNHAKYEMTVENDKITKDKKVYAVVLTTTDGNTYGLHHVTEIWHVAKLGFKADPALVGKTISTVTYYTNDGIIKLNLAKNQYVPHIAEDAKAEVAEPSADAESTKLTLSGFPKDFEQKVKVPEGMTYSDGTITFNSALPGSYKVTVSDAKDKYADVTASFTVSTNMTVAQYDSESVSLKAADKANDAALANYLNNITSVKVGNKEYAATGKKAVTIINSNGYLDLTAEPFANMTQSSSYTITVKANYYKDQEFKVTFPEHIYAYAAVPYDEYWQREGVYLDEGSKWDVGSEELDGHKEYDKGAFDAVSRATTNHGLHRGSFQQSVVIHTKDNDKDYYPVAWTDGDNFVDADGKTYNKKEIGMTSYKITGIKYVPVKVSSSDFVDFCKQYTVTQNGETLQGGFSEFNLNAYTAVAAVDKDTNGLKEVTKDDSLFSFGPRKTGKGSGIKGEALKTADENIKPEAKTYSGNFGEMLRVDLDNTKNDTKYYGDLGGHMQTVVWKYYGNGDTVLQTYGTKFAADNWMHKFMGIQLGLTDSLRAKLPDGTDGTGKWTITVYALGYSDTTYTVNVTAENLPKKVEPMTEEQKEKLESLRDQAKVLLDAAKDSNNLTPAETTLKAHYDQIVALLADKDATKAAADELIDEVPGYITAVENERKSTTNKTANGEATVSFGYTAKVTVTFDSDGKVVSVVDNGTAPDSNSYFWNIALGHFDRFVGVTKDTVDSVDATSGATVSMNAVKEAVKNALSNN